MLESGLTASAILSRLSIFETMFVLWSHRRRTAALTQGRICLRQRCPVQAGVRLLEEQDRPSHERLRAALMRRENSGPLHSFFDFDEFPMKAYRTTCSTAGKERKLET